mgnify:CR=1 FL=1
MIIENGIVIKRILGEYKEICKEVNCIDLRKYGITLPGFIDIHTHLRGLRLEYKEDERSGSMAAAKGGFTAIVDMPNTLPEINNVNALKLKLEKLALHSYVNYGIYVSPSNEPNELNNMLKYDGVVGVNATRDLEKLIDYVEEGQIDIHNAFSRIKDVIDAIQTIFDIQSQASSNISVDLAIA